MWIDFTVTNKVVNKSFKATHTTPNPVSLNHLLNEMVNEDVPIASWKLALMPSFKIAYMGLSLTVGCLQI